jgi:hypothetical protein
MAGREYTKYITWLRQEFLPLTVTTPDVTIKQIVENSIRFWNTHSAYRVTTMVDYSPGTKRVQLNNQFKAVADVYPSKTTTWIWNDHPLWTLMGITVLDNITGDLILLSEAFRNYRVYVGTDFQWIWEKSDDPTIGGYLYCINVPVATQKLYVAGTKRITENEDVKIEPVLDWIYRYSKALLKQVEGNTLRKSSIIGIANDGQQLVDEGKEEMGGLQERLAEDSRWIVFARKI